MTAQKRQAELVAVAQPVVEAARAAPVVGAAPAAEPGLDQAASVALAAG